MRRAEAYKMCNSIFKTKAHLVSSHECFHKSLVALLVVTRVLVMQKNQLAAIESICPLKKGNHTK